MRGSGGPAISPTTNTTMPGANSSGAVTRPAPAEEQHAEHDDQRALGRCRCQQHRGKPRRGGRRHRRRYERLHHAEHHRRRQHAVNRLAAPHQPHDRKDDGEDGLPGGEHHRQRDEQQRACLIGGTQGCIGADIDGVEKTLQGSPYEQPYRDLVAAVTQQRCGNERDERRVTVRPVGVEIAAGVEHDDTVDGDLHRIAEARQEHRPSRRRIAAPNREGAGVERRIGQRVTRRGEVRQRHGTARAVLPQRKSAQGKIVGVARLEQPQPEDGGDHDQRLEQQVRHEARGQQPAPRGFDRCLRRDLAHSLIRPCWTASNTASLRVWTSSLR
ncbi:hypothetical protein ACVI3S_007426 [Bradyrhizobium diazoefficiens]